MLLGLAPLILEVMEESIWGIIITALTSGLTVGGVVEVFAAIRFRKQTARQKEADTKISESSAVDATLETERKKMELGEDYLEKVSKLSEQIYQATLRNGTDNTEILQKIGTLQDAVVTVQAQVSKTDGKITLIEAYLNGGLVEFKKEQEAKNGT